MNKIQAKGPPPGKEKPYTALVVLREDPVHWHWGEVKSNEWIILGKKISGFQSGFRVFGRKLLHLTAIVDFKQLKLYKTNIILVIYYQLPATKHKYNNEWIFRLRFSIKIKPNWCNFLSFRWKTCCHFQRRKFFFETIPRYSLHKKCQHCELKKLFVIQFQSRRDNWVASKEENSNIFKLSTRFLWNIRSFYLNRLLLLNIHYCKSWKISGNVLFSHRNSLNFKYNLCWTLTMYYTD